LIVDYGTTGQLAEKRTTLITLLEFVDLRERRFNKLQTSFRPKSGKITIQIIFSASCEVAPFQDRLKLAHH
jgi:hypothetical protein